MKALRVCLDARLASGQAGGVEQAIIGLAAGLSGLSDGDEEYLFLTYSDRDEWLRPYISGPCHLLHGPLYARERQWKERLKRTFPGLYVLWNHFGNSFQTVKVPKSPGTVERSGAALVHFTTQSGFLTETPSIYQPHDLQHMHLPDFFGKRERMLRDVLYRAFCAQASTIAVMSHWSRQDLMKHYGLAPEKVIVVPGASTTRLHDSIEDELDVTRRRLSLPEDFIFYPAQTWAHKNHLGLLQSLVIVRQRYNVTIPLVCTGGQNGFFTAIEKQMHAQQLASQVHFLGFINSSELRCLYHLCRFMVFPSKFEGFGIPLVEAFDTGTAVACSNATCLPEVAGDAALLFDPDEPEEIAETIYRLWTDETLRQTLIERGRKRATVYSWERTARTFRAHYRRIAGRQLTEEDRTLIEASTPSVKMSCNLS